MLVDGAPAAFVTEEAHLTVEAVGPGEHTLEIVAEGLPWPVVKSDDNEVSSSRGPMAQRLNASFANDDAPTLRVLPTSSASNPLVTTSLQLMVRSQQKAHIQAPGYFLIETVSANSTAWQPSFSLT